MGQELPVTSYAVLGLLTFGDELTGYELKQRADRTLRFYWVAPAMSQIYTELARLSQEGLVAPRGQGRRTTYAITGEGRRRLARWLEESPVGFPVLKHPVALRLLVGHLVDPEVTLSMLRNHLGALNDQIAALADVRTSLEGVDAPGQPFRHPALVADWGLAHYTNERATIEDLIDRLEHDRR